MSKRLLIIDVNSNALDIALRSRNAGWEVQWYDKPSVKNGWSRCGEGIFKKIRDYDELRTKWLHWADLILLMDNAYYLDMLDPYFKTGYPIYGCNMESVKLELDRDMGQKVMADCGMQVIPTKRFNDYDSAIAFAKKNPNFLVSKPSGDAAKALSYVASNCGDLEYMLGRWKSNPAYRAAAKRDGFILQEKKVGCEMAAGGWFGPSGWSKWFCENWEYKKLMDGDLGIATGEQGTLARCVKKSKLAEQVLMPLTPVLEKLNYVGYVDVNCIIDDDGPWPLEFTMRDGCPVRYNMAALRKGDPAQWMLDLIDGKDTNDFSEDVSVSVVISIPDYPYSKLTLREVQGIPVYNATDTEHIHPVEMMLGEAPVIVGDKTVMLPNYVTSSDYVLVATGTGSTITGARRSCYSAVKKVKIPNNPQYRTDIGAGRLKRQLPDLHRMGYARGLEF